MSRYVRYIFVEGNIGAGKSTFIARVGKHLEKLLVDARVATGLITVLEPLDAWTRVGGRDDANLLDAFYRDMPRFAALFQAHAMVTRVASLDTAIEAFYEQHATSCADELPLYVLCERSIFTDKYVFVEAMRQDGCMTQLEVDTYNVWWQFWHKRMYPGETTAVVYLACSSHLCASHIAERARHEEMDQNGKFGIQLTYLDHLSALHERALEQSDTWNAAPRIRLNVEEIGAIHTDDASAATCAAAVFASLQK